MSSEERNRILIMVSAGTISPVEAERLFEEMDGKAAAIEILCPYCAEAISGSHAVCPVCESRLDGESRPGLSTLSKGLAWYALVISAVLLLSAFMGPGFQTLLAGLGLAAAMLLFKGRRAGWMLGTAWSAAQVLLFYVDGHAVNAQFLKFDFNLLVNEAGFGINLVGIALLVLFIKAAPEWRHRR